MRRFVARIGLFSLLSLLMAPVAMPFAVAAGTPSTLSYTGRFLDNAGSPVTVPVELRFSFWSSGDWVSGDASGGSINTGAAAYGGWSETQTVSQQVQVLIDPSALARGKLVVDRPACLLQSIF